VNRILFVNGQVAGATVELELVPGATHFWNGADDVAAIVRRPADFLGTLKRKD
jgi:hypothetical protein